MRAVVGLEGRDNVSVDRLPVDLGTEIREGFTKGVIETTRTFLVRRSAWLWRMVKKIVGEQFVEELEIAAGLHFKCVATYDSLW
ncbi:hypothetical protein D3C71_2056200 [compost metagenome]